MQQFYEQCEDVYQEIQKLPVHQLNRFIIIKPFGNRYKKEIIAFLNACGVNVLRQLPIESWHGLSFFLYTRREMNQLEWKIRFEINKAFQEMEQGTATLLLLDEQIDIDRLYELKWKIRNMTGLAQQSITLSNGNNVSLKLHSVHTPDEDRLQYELKVIFYFLGNKFAN